MTVFPTRRLASNVIHLVDPGGLDVCAATHFGASFYSISSPAVALCRAVLREGPGGALVWMKQRETCRACTAVMAAFPGTDLWLAPEPGVVEAIVEYLDAS